MNFFSRSLSIPEVDWPAVPEYPTSSPYADQLDKAQQEFDYELAHPEGWTDQGEKDGVKLYKKVNKDDKDGLPTVKGVCIVDGAKAEEFLGLIQLVGMRKRWDPRMLEGFMLARTDRTSYSFYSCMAGFGWIVSPRDIVGANRNVLPTESNSDTLIVQTSIVDLEHAPEQSGRVRATLGLSGWRLRPVDGGLEVTYIVRTALNGSLPRAIVDKVASEIPLCTGRARDVYHNTGFPPYIRPTATPPDPECIFQLETFSNPGEPIEFHCKITTAQGTEFELVYDKGKMFSSGVAVEVDGSGVEVADDGAGVITVRCTADRERVDIALRPL